MQKPSTALCLALTHSLPRGSTASFFLLYILMHGPSHSFPEASVCSLLFPAHIHLLHYLPTFFSIWQASILFQGLFCQDHHSSSLSTCSSQTGLLTLPPLCSKCDLSIMLGISQFSITVTKSETTTLKRCKVYYSSSQFRSVVGNLRCFGACGEIAHPALLFYIFLLASSGVAPVSLSGASFRFCLHLWQSMPFPLSKRNQKAQGYLTPLWLLL